MLPGTPSKVEASDTDIINYADITIPAWDVNQNYGYSSMNVTLKASIPEITISHIQYNKVTKKFTYTATEREVKIYRYLDFGPANYGNYEWLFDTVSTISIKDAIPWTPYSDPYDGYIFYKANYLWPVLTGPAPWTTFTIDNSNKVFEGGTVYDGVQYGSYNLQSEPVKLQYIFTIRDKVSYPGYLGGAQVQSFNWSDTLEFNLYKNSAPTLSLTTPSGQTLQNETGMNTLNVEGYVQDADNNDLTLSAEIPNVLYKKIVVTQTGTTKGFSIPIDVLSDALPPGDYTLKVIAVDPSNASASASLTLKVRQRLKRNMFVLINSPIMNSTKYTDYEGDSKYAERYKYQHDPNYFDNSMGLISDAGIWRNTPYESFPLTGDYVATYQPRDTPDADDRFNEYRIWSKDNLTQLSFQVHRKPIAQFAAKLVGGTLQISDSSYDLDHITRSNKGLSQWQWQYKKGEDLLWIDGIPTGTLSTSENYLIRLRVRDVDGENGLGVWSDWRVQTVGLATGNLAPVALFTVEPSLVSYRKETTITDKSFDPDNDPLDVYNWTVIKDGWQQVWSSWGGAVTPPNIAAYGIGNYQINLQVHDNRGLWSEWYSQSVQVLNHPPVAAFYMPLEVYRDTVITMDNLTPDPDEDGDNLSYIWNGRLNGGAYYYAGSNRNQVMTIRDLINQNGITPKKAISEGWEMLLTASDGAQNSYATHSFTVKNHVPTAAISGPETAFQYDKIPYTSADEDLDSSDVASLQYYWKVTDSDGVTSSYRTANIQVDFPETGVYTLEHWVVDQIGDKSNIATLKVNVTKNLAPSMSLTAPTGTVANPTILDAILQGDPLIQWTYADPENDSQEKYRLEFFFTQDDLLAKTVENADSSGSIRQYQVPNLTFERFQYFYLYGRSYSKGSWSEVSNEKAFIIDNPPEPGMTLITDTGRDAKTVPIYRTDILNIKSTAVDLDESKGDSLSYQYYLKPASGTEGLASTQKDFTKQFTTNGTFTLRQVVKDSLGLFREISQSITVQNRIPTVSITYPTSDTQANPTIASTLTPIMKWNYQDEDGDLQQRYKVRIINISTGAIKVQSGEQVSSAKQWQIPAGSLIENEKYAVEVEAFDGYSWSSVSPRKYFMVNLLSIKGGVQHTEEWNNNRKGYNLKQSGSEESPRGYNVYWAGERFVLQGITTGLPDTVEVTMTGGYTTQLNPTNSDKTLWTGSLYDSSFENLPNGPVIFTFTAKNEYNTKVDSVTVVISEDWSEYFRSHRIK